MMSVTYYAIIIFNGVATLGPTGPLALPSSHASTHNSCTIAIVVLTYLYLVVLMITGASINIANISATKNIFNIDR